MWHCPRVQRCLPPLLIQVGVSAGGRGAGGAYCRSAQRSARGRVLGSPLSRPLDAISAAHLHADIIATFNYEYALTFELRKLGTVDLSRFKNLIEDFNVFPAWCSLLGVRV